MQGSHSTAADGSHPKCNGRKKGWRKKAAERLGCEPDDPQVDQKVPQVEPGEHAGDPYYCGQAAGWKTDHPGVGRCTHHGGSTPITHGNRSKLRRYDRLKSTLADLPDLATESEQEALDTLPELAAARALFSQYMREQDELRQALLDWHRSENGEAPPSELPSLQEGMRLLEAISRMVKRVEDAKAHNAISRSDLHRVTQEMWRAVEAHVDDPETIEKIRDAWLRIRFD